MKKSFKYALVFLAAMLLIAFFSRERFTMYPSSEEPENPERLENPYNNILYTRGGADVSPASDQIGNDLPMGNV
jgi:hypothetical protein